MSPGFGLLVPIAIQWPSLTRWSRATSAALVGWLLSRHTT